MQVTVREHGDLCVSTSIQARAEPAISWARALPNSTLRITRRRAPAR